MIAQSRENKKLRYIVKWSECGIGRIQVASSYRQAEMIARHKPNAIIITNWRIGDG